MLDLGIYVSSDCSFKYHIANLNNRTKHLTGWILRTFSSRGKLTMLTLFKALVMSRLDYGYQLWSPHLTKHINMIEKTQRFFSRYISGMQGLSYPERLTVFKLYSLQCRRERYIIICVWTLLEYQVPNFSLLYILEHLIVEEEHVLHLTLVLEDWEHWLIIALDGEPSVCLTNYLCSCIIQLYVLFIVSRRNWIYIYLQCLIFHASRDLTIAWTMETVWDGRPPVMAWLTTQSNLISDFFWCAGDRIRWWKLYLYICFILYSMVNIQCIMIR